MRRRDFITLLGGAAAWPIAARAQERMRRIGVLMGGAETDQESHPRMSILQQGLEKLGWKVGRNLRIDYRWTMADLDRTRAGAEELLRLSPDVLLADGAGRASALLRATRTVPIVLVIPSLSDWCRALRGQLATPPASPHTNRQSGPNCWNSSWRLRRASDESPSYLTQRPAHLASR